jgi:hypothetical protein
MAFCANRNVEFLAAPGTQNSGYATSTEGLIPFNGLRHPPAGDTTGWYLWCGEEFSEAPDYFAAIHTYHLYEMYPQFIPLLGLPPGFRFLIAGGYLDVWFDAALLKV